MYPDRISGGLLYGQAYQTGSRPDLTYHASVLYQQPGQKLQLGRLVKYKRYREFPSYEDRADHGTDPVLIQ